MSTAVLLIAHRGKLTKLAAAAGGVVLVLVLIPVLIFVDAASQCANQTDGAGGTGTAPQINAATAIPAAYRPLFNEAARVWDVNPYLLASVAYQESTMGQHPTWREVNASGCVGFMQMCVGGAGGNSWGSRVTLTKPSPTASVIAKNAHSFGVRPIAYPFKTSVHPDTGDPFDGIMAGAVWLRAKHGGRSIPNLNADAYRALCGYYGACADRSANYATAVFERAKTYRDSDTPARDAIPSERDNEPSGSPRSRLVDNAAPSARVRPLGLAADPGGPQGGGEERQRMIYPTRQHTVTSPFGPRGSPCAGCSSFHQGTDFGSPEGEPIHAVLDGIVSYKGVMSGYGNYLCLRHGALLSTCYAHQSRFADQPVGAPVKQNDIIGYVGHTGVGTGAHLHFEVRVGPLPSSPAVNAIGYLQGASSPIGGELTPVSQPAGCADPGASVEVTDAGSFVGGELAWPMTGGGNVIQHANQAGSTHDPATGANNWQTDNALDIAAPVGTPILAVADGQICAACGIGAQESRDPIRAGLRLTLLTNSNAVWYAHLSRFAPGLTPGAKVKRGQVIGYSGSANGVAHLHIAVQNGRPETLFGTDQKARPT